MGFAAAKWGQAAVSCPRVPHAVQAAETTSDSGVGSFGLAPSAGTAVEFCAKYCWARRRASVRCGTPVGSSSLVAVGRGNCSSNERTPSPWMSWQKPLCCDSESSWKRRVNGFLPLRRKAMMIPRNSGSNCAPKSNTNGDVASAGVTVQCRPLADVCSAGCPVTLAAKYDSKKAISLTAISTGSSKRWPRSLSCTRDALGLVLFDIFSTELSCCYPVVVLLDECSC